MRNDIAHPTLRLAPLLLGAILCAAASAQTAQTEQPATPAATTDANANAAPAVQDSAPGVTPPAVAQQQKKEIAHGDPGRWYSHDSTAADQLRTVRKEIAAALQEATLACKHQPAAERGACMKEARSTYQHDMVNAKAIRDENNRLE
jgi:guanyl-specific ribonuclease Sa